MKINFYFSESRMSSESHSQTALASLHATYTDSEGEIESDAEEETSRDKYLTPSKESTPSSMEKFGLFISTNICLIIYVMLLILIHVLFTLAGFR